MSILGIFGGISQCVMCETVYEINESTSNVPQACCSIECENNYKGSIECLEFLE